MYFGFDFEKIREKNATRCDCPLWARPRLPWILRIVAAVHHVLSQFVLFDSHFYYLLCLPSIYRLNIIYYEVSFF